MALIDALLLESYRMNVWIAARADGVPGTGTHSHPYDGSTQAKFDTVMYSIPTSPPTRVHLGPGIFQSAGYADGISGAWQPKPGMKIVGSGIGVTTLQLVGASSAVHYCAIGHALPASGQQNLVDYFEVSDLTIDCNLAAAAGCV